MEVAVDSQAEIIRTDLGVGRRRSRTTGHPLQITGDFREMQLSEVSDNSFARKRQSGQSGARRPFRVSQSGRLRRDWLLLCDPGDSRDGAAVTFALPMRASTSSTPVAGAPRLLRSAHALAVLADYRSAGEKQYRPEALAADG